MLMTARKRQDARLRCSTWGGSESTPGGCIREPGALAGRSLRQVDTSRNSPESSWPGTPCDSSAWPWSRSLATFEARRAIGQMVRSHFDCVSDRRFSGDVIVAYLRVADELEAEIEDIRADLVAEARARGLTWDEIGQPLKITGRGAQKRFGQGLTPERLTLMREEAKVVNATKRVGMHAVPEDLEELEGTTPTERLNYMRTIVDGMRRDFDDLMKEMVSDAPVLDKMLRLVHSFDERLPVLSTLAFDRELWDVAGRVGQPVDPDDSHYCAPATYLYLALRLTMTATLWITGIPRQDASGGLQARSEEEMLRARSIDDLGPASDCIEMAWRLFRRKDVLGALDFLQASG